MTLLPCSLDVCQECAVKHEPEMPHNAQSLYYQYRFYGNNGRWPTWDDAIEHCDETTKQQWIGELSKRGHWPIPEKETL